MKKNISILIIIITLFLGSAWFYKRNIKAPAFSKGWTLFINEYKKNSLITPDLIQVQRIEGYKTSLECQEKGASMIKENQRYVCGLDCEKAGTLCKKLCSSIGCN